MTIVSCYISFILFPQCLFLNKVLSTPQVFLIITRVLTTEYWHHKQWSLRLLWYGLYVETDKIVVHDIEVLKQNARDGTKFQRVDANFVLLPCLIVNGFLKRI